LPWGTRGDLTVWGKNPPWGSPSFKKHHNGWATWVTKQGAPRKNQWKKKTSGETPQGIGRGGKMCFLGGTRKTGQKKKTKKSPPLDEKETQYPNCHKKRWA